MERKRIANKQLVVIECKKTSDVSEIKRILIAIYTEICPYGKSNENTRQI